MLGPFPEYWACPQDDYSCYGGYPKCISSARLCDSFHHCENSRDELFCGKYFSITNLTDHLHELLNTGVCGGILSHQSGHLTSPSYPKQYPSNSDCTYTILQPNNTFIHLTTIAFEIQGKAQGDCKDYVEIKDGPSSDYPLIGRFCGNAIPSSVQSTQNNLWIR